jgi:hypothetical protein
VSMCLRSCVCRNVSWLLMLPLLRIHIRVHRVSTSTLLTSSAVHPLCSLCSSCSSSLSTPLHSPYLTFILTTVSSSSLCLASLFSRTVLLSSSVVMLWMAVCLQVLVCVHGCDRGACRCHHRRQRDRSRRHHRWHR